VQASSQNPLKNLPVDAERRSQYHPYIWLPDCVVVRAAVVVGEGVEVVVTVVVSVVVGEGVEVMVTVVV